MTAFTKTWNDLWYCGNYSQHDLGRLRFFYFIACFIVFRHQNFLQFADTDESLWFPISLFKFFNLSPPSRELYTVLQPLWLVSLLTAAFGFMTRISTSLSLILGIYLWGSMYSVVHFEQAHKATIIGLALIALSDCGRCFSVDSYLKRIIPFLNSNSKDRNSSNYNWPFRLGQFVWCGVFFSAGYSKLYNTGVKWADAENLRQIITWAGKEFEFRRHSEIQIWFHNRILASNELLSTAGWLTLILELLVPLAFFSKRARLPILLTVIAFQVGINMTTYIWFSYFLPTYLFWLPARRLTFGVKPSKLNSN